MKKHTSDKDTVVQLEAHALLVGDIVVMKDGTKSYISKLAWDFGTVTISMMDASYEKMESFVVTNHRVVNVVENRTCYSCFGSGEYHGRGVIHNGKFEGFVGPCFSCESKGFQNRADILRCWRYHQLNPRRIYD